MAELDAVDEDLGSHGPVRPGHGGRGALGYFDPHDQHAPVEPAKPSASGTSSDNEPMSEEPSIDAVLETPPPSPH